MPTAQHDETLLCEMQGRAAAEATLASRERIYEGRIEDLADQFAAAEGLRYEAELHSATLEQAKMQAEGSVASSVAAAVAATAAPTAGGAASTLSTPVQWNLNGPDDEQFSLPDFVQSGANSQVLSFVQKLMHENAALKQQQQQGKPLATAEMREAASQPPKSAFLEETLNLREMSAERAAAFAQTVSESDGHQIVPLLGLLEKHKGSTRFAHRSAALGRTCVSWMRKIGRSSRRMLALRQSWTR